MTARRIIIAGGFGLPDRTASALRAVGLAKLFAATGRVPLILGKFEQLPDGSNAAYLANHFGIEMRDIRKPFAYTPPSDYIRSAASVEAIVKHLGAQQIDAIVLYNFPVRGIMAVRRLCKRLGIPLVLDLSEWYGWEGPKVLRNIIRVASSETRMRVLSRLVGNTICTSSIMQNALGVRNTFVLPFVVDPTEKRWTSRAGSSIIDHMPKRLVYSGSPGVGMHKDRLPDIIKALASLPSDARFKFDIYGITESEFIAECPDAELCHDRVGAEIRFHGRVSHEKSLDALAQAHFSVFLRYPNRVANMGFPTKYMEATTLGVPVITNDTSDICKYLEDGRNGLLARTHSIADMSRVLNVCATMSEDSYNKMRTEQRKRNPFSIENWIDEANDFLSKVRNS